MILAEGEIVELHERFGTMHTDIGPYLTREAGSNRSIYYQVGLEVARRTFTAYSDIIDGILRDMGYRAPPLPAQKH